DSMVGHRTDAYEEFGKASARIDDWLNWVPARVCAILFCLCARKNFLGNIRTEAAGHASPNAGWGESALPQALGVGLVRDNSYDGILVRGPVFNPSGRRAGVADVHRSLNWMWRVSVAGTGVFLLVTFLVNKLQSK